MAQQSQKFKLAYQASEVEGQCLLNEITTIRLNLLKFILYVFCSIACAGIPVLVVHWYPHLKRKFYYDFTTLEKSSHVAVLNYDEELTICDLQTQEIYFDEIAPKKCKVFVNRYMKYVVGENKVVQSLQFDYKSRLTRISTSQKQEVGLEERQVTELRRCFGKGTMQIEQPKWYQILVKELLRPLYLFLFFSVGLWYYELYNIYASIILGTTVIAIGITVYQLLQLNSKIYQMAYYETKVNALRNGNVVEVSSVDLVPGDIVFLKHAAKIPFEGVILEGSALINQCALTGESVPVVKKADLNHNYARGTLDKAALIFEGTSIIQTNCKKKMLRFESTRQSYGMPVCVTRTNFLTLKGQLIRIILFPKQQQNLFQKESAKFLICLFAVAVLTYFCMIPHLQSVVEPFDMFIKFLDLIAITVPAALPVSMAFGIIYAIDKLKTKSIFCVEENKVIAGGAVDFCCFDKTGTLTQDFMDFEALVPAFRGLFHETILNRKELKLDLQQEIVSKPYLRDILNNIASNHSIISIETTGEKVGDPMQIKLLEFGEYTLNQSHADPEVIFSFESARGQNGDVFRRFQFDSDLQRMTVVAKIAGTKDLQAFCKGSPQIMAPLFSQSSMPANYSEVLNAYTSNGFRVLAIGSKRIEGVDYKSLTREILETGLTFNGFEIFENKLKAETQGAIRELRQAKIGVVMITGDNALTGSNIGYKSGIAHREQGMLICDYKEGTFLQEKFQYRQRQSQQAEPSHLIEEFPVVIEDLSGVSLGSNRVANAHTFRKPSSFYNIDDNIREETPISDPDIFLKKIIETAQSTNSQLCVTGNAFNKLFEGKVEEISYLKKQFLSLITVYARTKPNDKAKIVQVYQHTGKTVSMCGDGANDCGALKQADIGLSLSQAEASISAPFTSQIANISSMVELIKECRAGLATNFSLFNIMAIYSLIEYTSSIILQLFFAYPADLHYIYWDIFCNFMFIILVGYTGTAEKLSVARPNNSLFCFSNLFQILFAFALNVVGQVCMILSLSGAFSQTIDYPNNGGFEVNKQLYLTNEDFSRQSPETNILFLFANFMLLSTMLTFNLGQPWKQSVFTNKLFMLLFLFVLTYSIVIVMVPAARLTDFFLVFMVHDSQNGFVLAMALLFGGSIYGLQKGVWEPLSIWLKQRYPDNKWL